MRKGFSILIAVFMLLKTAVCLAEAEDSYKPYINGYDDGTFRPESNITRAETAGIFSELLENKEIKETVFADVDENDWYSNPLKILNNNGFLKYYGDFFEPDTYITRIEFASFIYMYKNGTEKDVEYSDMFSALINDGIIKGYDDGTYGNDRCITRAEGVALINRALGVKISKESITGLNRETFKDVPMAHWAYNDITLASKASRTPVSYPREIPSDYHTKAFDKYNEKQSEWQTVAMINDELRSKGVKYGGEGAQRMNAMAISSDGKFLLCGNDVSSIHRSVDGGNTWEMCNRGFYAKSGEAFAIDPNNNDRCIAYGGNHTAVDASNGIYLSTDRGFSWDQKLIQKYNAPQLELRESLCYDASSYDEAIGGSAVAYWSKDYWLKAPSGVYKNEEDIPKGDENEKKGLWKTEDGGNTWFVVNEEMTDSIVKVNPSDGTVYAANLKGFFRSTDGGRTFEHILSGCMIYGMDVIDTYPDNVYVNDYKGVLVSEDKGKSFRRIDTITFPKAVDITNPYKQITNLKVSPVNPEHMVVAYGEGFGAYRCAKYYSLDGGKSWSKSVEKADKDFFLKNNREAMFLWSPTDENKVWSFGGDWIVSSTDAGQNYYWDYEGGAAVFVDGRTIFNIYNPDLFYYGSQDFHGAFTADYGYNWKHIWKVSGGSQGAGFVYGSYAADEKTLIALASSLHEVDGVGGNGGWAGVSEIRVSRDAGDTWTNTGIFITDNHRKKWSEFCYQSPTDSNVLFAANYRSDDFGYTWKKMDIDVVYTHNPYGRKELYGAYDNHIMVSYDNGETWQSYAEAAVPEACKENPELTEIWDMSYDGVNDILYYISGHWGSGTNFCKIQNGAQTDLTERLQKDKYGATFSLVAVDPRYTQVVYVGGYNSRLNGPSIQRSVDMCESFQVIGTVADDLSVVKKGPAGGIQPYDLIVHPITGELWCTNGCAGWAKLAPPYEN